MKKTILALMIVFVIFGTLPLSTHSAFQVSVDDSFTYILSEAEASFNMYDTDYNRDFVTYEDSFYSAGTEMVVNVSSVTSNSINYSIDNI